MDRRSDPWKPRLTCPLSTRRSGLRTQLLELPPGDTRGECKRRVRPWAAHGACTLGRSPDTGRIGDDRLLHDVLDVDARDPSSRRGRAVACGGAQHTHERARGTRRRPARPLAWWDVVKTCPNIADLTRTSPNKTLTRGGLN